MNTSKVVTKNLLKNQRCENCGWQVPGAGETIVPYCHRWHKSFFLNETCDQWTIRDPGYYMQALKSAEEVKDFMENGLTIEITKECEVKGAKIFGPDRLLIFQQEFKDGPYYFPKGGGSLTIQWR